MLEAQDLSCRRGSLQLFEGLTFSLSAGETMLVKGPNGIGKSSLLRILAGLLPPTAGEIRLNRTNGADDWQDYRQHLHYVGHQNPVKPGDLVHEAMVFFCRLLGGDQANIVSAMKMFGLEDIADRPVRILSSGQRRRLSLSRLLLCVRPVWLLDEPAVGLDEAHRQLLQSAIEQHCASGGMAIIASHGDLSVRATQTLAFES